MSEKDIMGTIHDPVMLPSELFHLIAKDLGPKDKFRAMQVSKTWREAIAENRALWYELDIEDYPDVEAASKALELSHGDLRVFTVYEHDNLRFSESERQEEWIHFVKTTLATMHHLHTVELNGWDWLAPPNLGIPASLANGQWRSSALRDLKVACYRDNILDDIVEALVYTPNLERLSLVEIVPDRDWGIDWTQANKLDHLVSLELSSECVTGYDFNEQPLDWLPLPVVGANDLFKIAPNLEAITLTEVGGGWPSNPSEDLENWPDFRRFKKLTNMCISMEKACALPGLPPSLKHLKISINDRAFEPYSEKFPRPKLAALETLIVNYDRPVGTSSLWQDILLRSDCHPKILDLSGINWVSSAPSEHELISFEVDESAEELVFKTFEALARASRLNNLRALRLAGEHDPARTRELTELVTSSCMKLEELEWRCIPSFATFRNRIQTGKGLKKLLFRGELHQIPAFEDLAQA